MVLKELTQHLILLQLLLAVLVLEMVAEDWMVAQEAALVVLNGALRERLRVEVGDWPLQPRLVSTPAGLRIAVASRSARTVQWLDPVSGEASAPEATNGVPHLLSAGPLHEPGQGTTVVITREGGLRAFGPRGARGWELGLDAATLLAVEPGMLVVGSMAQGQRPDRLERITFDAEGAPVVGAPEPVPGIPRAWLVTPRAEWVCAGEDALLRSEAGGQLAQSARLGKTGDDTAAAEVSPHFRHGTKQRGSVG